MAPAIISSCLLISSSKNGGNYRPAFPRPANSRTQVFVQTQNSSTNGALVMARLKWRLRVITPFDFAHYFITKLSSPDDQYSLVSARASRIILSTCQGMDFLDYTPSAIAAAAVIFAANRIVDDENLCCFHKSLNHDNVRKCHYLVKQCMSHSTDIRQEVVKRIVPSSNDDHPDAAVNRKCADKNVMKSNPRILPIN